MNITSNFRKIAFLLLCTVVAIPGTSLGASKDKVLEIKNELKEYKRLESSIHKHASRLSSSQKLKLKASLPKGLHDSDDDGVADVIESHIDGTDDCSAGEHGGGTEVEQQGTVGGISGSNFSIGSSYFVLSDSVVYRNGDASSFLVGACVEIKGLTTANSTVVTVTRVSFKNSDDCA